VVVAYYYPEPLSAQADRLVRASSRPAISDLSEVEVVSALGRKVREGELAPVEAARIVAEFLGHLGSNLYGRVRLERRHYEMARDWIARLTVPLRTLDALQLAAATGAGLDFVTADRRLARAGRMLGARIVLLH
jgi:predicted nucleic acid-binding protein